MVMERCLLNAPFPLVPPPAGKNEEEKRDSNWERARREVYAQGQGGDVPVGPQAFEPFSEEKVNRMKDALVEAIRNAVNIRGLRPDDNLTVCVLGGGGPGGGNEE